MDNGPVLVLYYLASISLTLFIGLTLTPSFSDAGAMAAKGTSSLGKPMAALNNSQRHVNTVSVESVKSSLR